MRLLNTKTLEFKLFLGEERPPYVILSHRWSDDEVSYKELRKGTKTSGVGYEKITGACRTARERAGLEWIWIDSCCIDKRSSAELSEAINSMWRWYKDSFVCYVYLADVHVDDVATHGGHQKAVAQLRKSEWFERRWTLQELLAPFRCEFLTAGWEYIGSRYELSDVVSEVTSIPMSHLNIRRLLSTTCAAEKMHWASRRQTTRPEDMAYSLLGLFDINMPLLYGEGALKAMGRLQLAIFDSTGDRSLFIWTRSERGTAWWGDRFDHGIFAPSVANFRTTMQDYLELDDFEGMRLDEVTHRTHHRHIILGLDVEEWKAEIQVIYPKNNVSIIIDRVLHIHRLPFADARLDQIVMMIMKSSASGEWFIHRPALDVGWKAWLEQESDRMGLHPKDTSVARKEFSFRQMEVLRGEENY